jgi:hypothetical protein
VLNAHQVAPGFVESCVGVEKSPERRARCGDGFHHRQNAASLHLGVGLLNVGELASSHGKITFPGNQTGSCTQSRH